MGNALPGRNSLCSCGSGKKFKRCCGAERAQALPSLDEGLALGMGLLQRGEWARAQALLRPLVQVNPLHATLNYLFGFASFQAKEYVSAEMHMRRAIQAGLADPAAFYHHGGSLVALGRFADAAVAFEKAVALKPDFLPARTSWANCLFELREFGQAEQLYRQVLEQDPHDVAAIHNLAQIFYLNQQLPAAIAFFERAASEAPNVAEFRASMATMQEAHNQLDAAADSARMALTLEPRNVTAAVALARVLRRHQQADQALVTLDHADLKTAMPRGAIAYWAERGQILELLGRFHDAFHAYSFSKLLLSQTRSDPYDGQVIEQTLAQERDVLTLHNVTNWALNQPPVQPSPLFIVGFPRSGTTLLEQMLGCHPKIATCGELETVLGRETSRPEYPGNIAAYSDQDRQVMLSSWRADYLAQLSQHTGPADQPQYATDKLPLNLMRIGLIRLLFPEARIIHVVRHPLDAVLSAFFTPFLFGNEWSHRLPDAARMFVQSWRQAKAMQTLAGTHFLSVRYEDLIDDPETGLKAILAFLDLPWDPSCLNFQKNKRVAHTASYAQVTRPLYQTSKNRYRHFISEVDELTLTELRPVIAEAGYDIDDLIATL